MSDQDNRTEQATGKKRNDARRRGEVFRSQDITVVVSLAAGLSFLMLLGPSVGQGMLQLMRRDFSAIGAAAQGSPLLPQVDWLFNSEILMPVMILLGGVFVAVIASQLAQVGFLLTDEPLSPNLGKLNPLSGVQRLFSLRKLFGFGTSLAKLALVAGFVWAAVRELIGHDVFIRPVNVRELGAFLLSVLWAVGWRVLLALVVLALADYLYQRWQYERDMRMTKQEVKDEHKQDEGSPEVKRKIRAFGRRLLIKSMRRMLEDMQDATIVVTNPTHYAVALRYVRGVTPAPVVVAKGVRRNALRLKERARELGIPLQENKPLARGLYKHARVGEPIPVLYYQAVAAILAQLLRRGLRASGLSAKA